MVIAWMAFGKWVSVSNTFVRPHSLEKAFPLSSAEYSTPMRPTWQNQTSSAPSPSSAVLLRRSTRRIPVSSQSRIHCAGETMEASSYDSPSSGHRDSAHGTESPQSEPPRGTNDVLVRRRRRRMAIEIPADQTSSMNKDELKKLKNRIAAARARSRTQRQVEELEATVAQLRDENHQQQKIIEHLRSVIRSIRPDLEYDSGYGVGHTTVDFQPLLSPMVFHSNGCQHYDPECHHELPVGMHETMDPRQLHY